MSEQCETKCPIFILAEAVQAAETANVTLGLPVPGTIRRQPDYKGNLINHCPAGTEGMEFATDVGCELLMRNAACRRMARLLCSHEDLRGLLSDEQRSILTVELNKPPLFYPKDRGRSN